MEYIDQDSSEFGVELICTTLPAAGMPIAPSTFHAARHRPPSARAMREETVKAASSRVHEAN